MTKDRRRKNQPWWPLELERAWKEKNIGREMEESTDYKRERGGERLKRGRRNESTGRGQKRRREDGRKW